MLGLVSKKIIPRSTRTVIMPSIRAGTVKSFGNNKVEIMSDASKKLKITRNIVEIITPAFHTQDFPLYVSYENIRKRLPKTSSVVVSVKVIKNIIEVAQSIIP